jgi:hypothetical protein
MLLKLLPSQSFQLLACAALFPGSRFGVAELKYEIEKSMISNSYSLRLCATDTLHKSGDPPMQVSSSA